MSGECDSCGEHVLDCKCRPASYLAYKKEESKTASFLQPGTEVFYKDDLVIVVSPPAADSGLGWHMSISTRKRDPQWQEIRDAWYSLIPGADKRNGAMFFPPKDEYINVHPYCFHIHEVSKYPKNIL